MTSDERALKDLIGRRAPSHLECVAARDRVLHELRATPSERLTPRIGVTAPPASGWRAALPALPLAAAAAIILALVTVPIQWDATPGSDDVPAGDAVRAGEAGRMITLEDGSRVEMRARSELSIERAADGIGIRLLTGDIIVNAEKQRDGHLYVHTKEMTVAVVGTVFLVKAGKDGSRVAVIEGEVSVREGDTETRLRPGEQVSTSPVLAARPVRDDIIWSRNAGAHLAILESFAKGMAQTAGPLVTLNPAQTATAGPEFVEASIRACDPDNVPAPPPGARGGGVNSFMMTPGRMHALCLTVGTLIRTAYGYGPAELDFLMAGGRGRGLTTSGVPYGLGVEDGLRVRGGPDWVRSERYTIEAIADPSADGLTMSRAMLLALLERRFKLKAHIETEPVPAYALVVAPGGLKIKPSERDSCISYPADPTVPRINGVPVGARRPMLADVRRGEKRVCGQLPERNGPNQVFVAGSSTFSVLAQLLAARLGRVPVYDKTGITDPFDWILEFADENAPGAAALNPQTAPGPSDVPRGPTIFTAIEEQLGLRLEATQVPREYIVIDAIEKPGAN